MEKAGRELDPLVDVLMFMFPSSDALEFLEVKYSSMVAPNAFKLSAVQALREKLVVGQVDDFFPGPNCGAGRQHVPFPCPGAGARLGLQFEPSSLGPPNQGQCCRTFFLGFF